LEVESVEKQQTHKDSGEMLLSVRKIRYNLLKYWWICILVMGLAAGYVVLTTWREYKIDLFNASLDTYQTLATVYIDSADEDYTDAYKWLLYSDLVRDQVDEELKSNGFEPFDKDQDIIYVATKGDSMYYELTVRSIGLDRTMLIATKFEELLVSEAKNVMGLKGRIIDYPVASSYMKTHDGNVLTFELGEPKTVSLSLRSFLSWSKLMVLLAGMFVWLGSVLLLVLADKTFRTKEEVEAVIKVPCICEVNRKSQDACKLLAVMIQNISIKDRNGDFMLASSMKNDGLSEIAVNIKNCLKERYREAGETVAIHAAENMAVSAETLESGKTAGHVLLAITIDRDKIQDVERAVRNLEIVDANLIGYVLVK
jgi:capsular polysaccharide biosynthesis protein